VGAELFHAHGKIDGRTDRQTGRQTDRGRETNMTKLIVVFRNFTNASTNWTEVFHTNLFSKLRSEERSRLILILPNFYFHILQG